MRSVKRRLRRACVTFAVTAAVVAVLAPIASATSYWTPWTNIGTINGVNYQIRTAITTWSDGTGINARTTISADQNLSTNQARVYCYLMSKSGSQLDVKVAYSLAGDTTVSIPTDHFNNNGNYWAFGLMQAKKADGTWSLEHNSSSTYASIPGYIHIPGFTIIYP